MKDVGPAVREIDGAVFHDPRYATYETWSNLGFGLWFTVWGCLNLGSGNWVGWLMVSVAVLFLALGVWAIIWRWKSDVAHARLDGEGLGARKMLTSWIESVKTRD